MSTLARFRASGEIPGLFQNMVAMASHPSAPELGGKPHIFGDLIFIDPDVAGVLGRTYNKLAQLPTRSA